MLPEITEEMEDRRVVASAKEGTAEEGILKKQLMYLLCLREKEEEDYPEDGVKLVETLIKMQESRQAYAFNERVMKALIENEYIKKELDNDNIVYYPRFLSFILGNYESEELRGSACREIIRLFAPSDSAGEGDTNKCPHQVYRTHRQTFLPVRLAVG